MNLQTSPLNGNLAKISILLAMLVLSACKPAVPESQPTVAPLDSGPILPTPTAMIAVVHVKQRLKLNRII